MEAPSSDDSTVGNGHQPEGLLETIASLTRANRARRDPDLERRLVALRHAAFEQLDPPPSKPAFPAADPAPTSGASGGDGPLVPQAGLTPAAVRSAILRHGYAHVPGLVGQERVASLVAGIDRAFEASQANATGTPATETTPWFEPFEPPGDESLRGERNWVRMSGGLWAADSPRLLFDMLETFEEVGLRALITDYLGERPALSVNKCTLRRVPPGPSTPGWHQDGRFLEDVRALNVWLSLSHCGRDAPGLDIVPHRLDHVVETGTEGAAFWWSVSPAMAEQVSDGHIVRPEFAPGDVLLFDELLLHRTASEPDMRNDRYAIESWFFGPSAYPEKSVPLTF